MYEIEFLTAEVIVNLAHHSPDNPSGDTLQMGDGPGYSRNRRFAAHEALAIMNRPYGEAPILPITTVSTDIAGREASGIESFGTKGP
jgi:hypothetical protein